MQRAIKSQHTRKLEHSLCESVRWCANVNTRAALEKKPIRIVRRCARGRRRRRILPPAIRIVTTTTIVPRTGWCRVSHSHRCKVAQVVLCYCCAYTEFDLALVENSAMCVRSHVSTRTYTTFAVCQRIRTHTEKRNTRVRARSRACARALSALAV